MLRKSKNIIFITGLDKLINKNATQIRAINEFGWMPLIYIDQKNVNIDRRDLQFEILTAPKSAFFRTILLVFHIFNLRHYIRHIEVYPGGRFCSVYAICAKIFRLPLLVVERGDLFFYRNLSWLTQLSMRLTYWLASAVWYREVYPEFNPKEKLKEMGAKYIFFNPNCVEIATDSSLIRPMCERNNDLLWVNSFKSFRYPELVFEVLKKKNFSSLNAIFLGATAITADDAQKSKISIFQETSPNIRILGFENPTEYYKSSKYFILASELVFLNNSLLEAMSFQVIPIISNVPGSELIIENGVNGFTFNNNPQDFERVLTEVLSLSDDKLDIVGQKAQLTVQEKFSYKMWKARIEEIYRFL